MKRILLIFLIGAVLLGIVSCEKAQKTQESNIYKGITEKNVSEAEEDTVLKDTTQSAQVIPNQLPTDKTNLVIACDQAKNRVVVYDMDAYNRKNIEDATVWEFIPEANGTHNVSGVKYRSDTVFGNVVIMCASGGYAAIVKYPEKEVVWSVANSGYNPHSIEILPNGDVVVASSQGNTLRLYYTSALLNDNKAVISSLDYTLNDAHGVLWDPEYNCLWALGGDRIVCYKISEGRLHADTSRTVQLPSGGGHSLSADYADKKKLWISVASGVLRFDKEEMNFEDNYEHRSLLSRTNIKGFGNNLNGHFVFCYPSKTNTAVSESWQTGMLTYVYYKENGEAAVSGCKSLSSAYYKVMIFYGEYQ